jgi:hypothetical protein
LCVIPPFAFKIVSENLSPNYSIKPSATDHNQ